MRILRGGEGRFRVSGRGSRVWCFVFWDSGFEFRVISLAVRVSGLLLIV